MQFIKLRTNCKNVEIESNDKMQKITNNSSYGSFIFSIIIIFGSMNLNKLLFGFI